MVSITWQLLRRLWRPLLLLNAFCYLPLFVIDAVALQAELLPKDALEMIVGILASLLLPLVNGTTVSLARATSEGHPPQLSRALAEAGRCWGRLFTAYLSVGLFLAAFLLLSVLPAFVIMQVLKVEQPWVLLGVAVLTALLVLPRFVFIDAAVVVAGHGPYRARQLSSQLTKGHRLQLTGMAALLMGVPTALEFLGDGLEGRLSWVPVDASFGPWWAVLVNFTSTLLSIIPGLYFYGYFRHLAAKAAQPGGR